MKKFLCVNFDVDCGLIAKIIIAQNESRAFNLFKDMVEEDGVQICAIEDSLVQALDDIKVFYEAGKGQVVESVPVQSYCRGKRASAYVLDEYSDIKEMFGKCKKLEGDVK